MKLNPYLNFQGNCAEAMHFYQQCLGGEIVVMDTYGNTPARDHVPPECYDMIVHARLIVGDIVLMASDCPPSQYEKMQGISVTLNIDDLEQARRVFNALTEGGDIRMPFAQTFWAKGFGVAVDRFGTPWMVNCEAAVQ